MQLHLQSPGLAQVLSWDYGGGPGLGDKLVFAGLASSVAASPLLTISYSAKCTPVIRGVAAVAAAGLAYQALPNSAFSASALSPAPAVDLDAKSLSTPAAGLDFKPLLRVFHPLSMVKMLAKNVAMQALFRLNLYVYLQHEREALAAEQEGMAPPPPPEFPDLTPAVYKGCTAFWREFSISATRETYGCIARWRLGSDKAQALLRNSKLWIRDVLSVKYRSSSLGRRFLAYQFATMHAVALQYAADCTVSVVQHTYRTVKLKEGEKSNRLVYWVKGVVLQMARCGVILVAASIGAAVGSLVNPGKGTMVGQSLLEAVTMIAMGYAIDILME
ncbi:hypothetical protein VOLCADRAFT_104054 [Volvox carteri f. nagariensis]|uniref:Uncharacterized protein n=1 Tax=Volvox carteri f. nagariensis TaxID=3068 RepID=D8TQX3_VOLCA|nr:uncharacterized protein VOLCADRAFT_104054 [Volvox carteri f. nagariensis]EFJ50104.1 hypothetical protein VOLCADRAFT_104054 [Volvox carteri f. nagariensis]|eukprot:XP_002948724.1 hypothetical protein VOLCADRAFT_104054 [Volvox carteri f. nagariensis]